MYVTGGRLACSRWWKWLCSAEGFQSVPSSFWECTVGLFPVDWHVSLLPAVLNPFKFMPHNSSKAIDNLIL